MNEWEIELLRLNTRYKSVQQNPHWDEAMLNILNTAISDLYALSLIQSAEA